MPYPPCLKTAFCQRQSFSFFVSSSFHPLPILNNG
nr:MAG TPA: hypothetical protein [Caudoviricetes sp.]